MSMFFVVLIVLLMHPFQAFAVSCNPPKSGDLTITGDCAFSRAVDGVDGGTGTSNNAKITVSSGILTINPGQTVATGSIVLTGGSISINGTIKLNTPLWGLDGDDDGYPETVTPVAQTTMPSRGKRRSQVTYPDVQDINDTEYCPDGHQPAGVCRKCVSGVSIYQSIGQDLFNECPSLGCTEKVWGWSGTSCLSAASSAFDGTCGGSGSCTAFSVACQAGNPLASCGSSECIKTCNQGDSAALYDTVSEICYVNRESALCSKNFECDGTGNCTRH